MSPFIEIAAERDMTKREKPKREGNLKIMENNAISADKRLPNVPRHNVPENMRNGDKKLIIYIFCRFCLQFQLILYFRRQNQWSKQPALLTMPIRTRSLTLSSVHSQTDSNTAGNFQWQCSGTHLCNPSVDSLLLLCTCLNFLPEI